MAKAIKHADVVSGVWKFHPRINLGELIELAEEWKRGDDGSNYLDLHIRQCDKNKLGVGFIYKLNVRYRSPKKFFYGITDELKRRFGNNFAGWDYSNITWIVT